MGERLNFWPYKVYPKQLELFGAEEESSSRLPLNFREC